MSENESQQAAKPSELNALLGAIDTGPESKSQPAKYIGVCFVGKESIEGFWAISCPCGVVARYAVNELPLVDTPHPCGNPEHWTVKIYEKQL